ncbi:hypothetical protein BCEP4_500043 [Burkholderia cepacia]|nr:hypothetical protein BCEP4_500043 [Burkholderia cepacia]
MRSASTLNNRVSEVFMALRNGDCAECSPHPSYQLLAAQQPDSLQRAVDSTGRRNSLMESFSR